MEMYETSEHGNVETYMIQGSQSAPLSTTSLIQNIETMYNEGAPEFVAENGTYYPAEASYGYYCTGFESSGDWDQHGGFSVDGSEVMYQSGEMENLPYVYYAPSYGYGQSPYNPYNPYIPGAVVGLDGNFMDPQQFLINSQYQDCVPSSNYPHTDGNGMCQPEVLNNQSKHTADKKSTFVKSSNSRFPKRDLSSSSPPYTMVASNTPFSRPANFKKATDGEKEYSRPLQPSAYGRINHASSPRIDNVLNRSHINDKEQKGEVPVESVLARPASVADEQPAAGIIIHDYNQGKGYNVKAKSELLNDPSSQGFNLRNKLIVKAYTSRIGKVDAEENIVIHTDQYNKEDFPVDYSNAKFFVIKSYSEDDVHKSIKYNVWSSTPNGNKKLSNAYDDAQISSGGIPGGCPLFLFFSVNASGQFCGVAEMIGRVDFQRDMDFWQQDKWSGSFPVKWHMIKDVPNSTFRHITLSNNENKPVTNSRDTQEISFVQGQEMLKIFKNHKLKTSIFDDFMYYENRQKVIHEGRVKLLTKTYGTSLVVPARDPLGKPNDDVVYPLTVSEKPASVSANHTTTADPQIISAKDKLASLSSVTGEENMVVSTEPKKQSESEMNGEILSTLMIGSLTIDSKVAELLKPSKGPPVMVHPKPVETVTIGSLAVKFNGLSGPLTFGSLPPDIKGLKRKNKH